MFRNGLRLLELNRVQEAAAVFAAVLALAPRSDQAHNNLGVCLEALGDEDGALAAYQRAAVLNPGNAQAHRNTGKMLWRRDEVPAALAAQQRALAIRPDYALALIDLGSCQERLGHEDAALAAYRQALVLDPDSAIAQTNLGNLLFHQGEHQAARAHLTRAVELQPALAEAHGNLAALLAHVNDLAGAQAAYARAYELAPESPTALVNLALSCQKTCDWPGFVAHLPRLEAVTRVELAAGRRTSVAPFATLALPWPAELQSAVARATSRRFAADMRQLKDALAFDFDRAARTADPGRPLRIGYLSADFRDHAVSHLMSPVFGLHDRDRVRVVAYSQGEDDGSEYRRRIAADCDVFRDQRGLAHEAIARQIHADAIDVLVELHGHTSQHRLQVCALRPAPVIASYLGFPGRVGADFIDYALTDAIVTPPDEIDLNPEALVLLPDTYYVADDSQPIDPSPVQRADCGLPATGTVYCCFNGAYKIDPLIFGRWMDILRAVPGSVLWLWSDAPVVRAKLMASAEAAGVAGARLVFAESLPMARHLARLRLADLFLDTRIYNAHTTACNALWAGVPVLSCPGDTFAARVGASLLRAIGLPELSVPDLDAYAALAIHLGQDAEALARLKAKLATHRATHALFDTRRWVRNLEAGYAAMWATYAAGAPIPRVTAIRAADDPA